MYISRAHFHSLSRPLSFSLSCFLSFSLALSRVSRVVQRGRGGELASEVEVFLSSKGMGWGVRAKRPIPKGLQPSERGTT